MTDKQCTDPDSNFRGFRIGDLVCPLPGILFPNWEGIALIVDMSLNALMLGDGDGERYDAILTVVASGRLHYIHVDDVQKAEVNSSVF
jgi:hypothetical protein